MKRREFITLVSGAAAWPLSTRAQTRPPTIGVLGSVTESGWAPYIAAFRQGLGDSGFVEGRNVAVESRWANGQYDRLPALATDLIQRNVALIAAFTTPSAHAAKAATTTIPIVFTTIGDPVEIGLVASLSRPGGNLTGVTLMNVEIGQKLLELLREAMPSATAIALLVNATNPNSETVSRNMQAAASAFGLQLHVLRTSTEQEFDATFAKVRELRADGLVIAGDAFFNTRTSQLATLSLRYSLPAIYQDREFTAAGGLMSYASNVTDLYRQAGVYAGRILKGEKPADLPIVQTTKVELIINLKTAKALGLNLSLPLLGRADEIIE